MSTNTESLLAKRLLELFEHGWTLQLYFRWTWKWQLISIVVLLAACILLGAAIGGKDRVLESFATLLLGFLVGSMLREFAQVRANAKAWPLSKKVIDWNIVRRIAAGTGQDGEAPGT